MSCVPFINCYVELILSFSVSTKIARCLILAGDGCCASDNCIGVTTGERRRRACIYRVEAVLWRAELISCEPRLTGSKQSSPFSLYYLGPFLRFNATTLWTWAGLRSCHGMFCTKVLSVKVTNRWLQPFSASEWKSANRFSSMDWPFVLIEIAPRIADHCLQPRTRNSWWSRDIANKQLSLSA